MRKILVSRCLLGDKVRYDGASKPLINEAFDKLIKSNRIIFCCPEVDGGLSIPRSPSERVGDRVINKDGIDVTKEYMSGSLKALSLAVKYDPIICIMKAKSPACGNKEIYDGSFTKTLIKGEGTASELLIKNGYKVFNETEINEAIEYLKENNEYE